jgi:hypothetical protein
MTSELSPLYSLLCPPVSDVFWLFLSWDELLSHIRELVACTLQLLAAT